MRIFHRMGMAVLAVALAGGLAACAQMVTVNRAATVPGAVAKAKIAKDDNGNAKIELEVKHLAPANQLTPPRQLYVVWAQTKDARVFMLGQLKMDDEYNGKFAATAPVTGMRLIVSAEDSTVVTQPSSQVVLSTDHFEAD